jgi:asparagine synthase (glutamine-hydrolysing)
MCGIAGMILAGGQPAAAFQDRLVRMRDVITHRGPDDAGIHVEGPVGLAHRRLSIVDLGSGHQPMSDATGRYWIVFNGEIYNHLECRKQLEANGVVFRTHSDTESILQLYMAHGEQCVEHLRGMFAFAVWDRDKKTLFLARDRVGIKPLYYSLDAGGSLYFGSEIKAILQSGAVAPRLNTAALPDYLANRGTSDNATMYQDILRLEPGHWMKWKDGKISIRKYWDIKARQAGVTDSSSEQKLVSDWRDLFEESVRVHLMADVPLGMFLSGGIDSSAIAAVMSRAVDRPIKTFSVAFDDPNANELPFARQVARAFGTDHHEIMVPSEAYAASLPHLVWHEDEPIGHSASVALYFVSQLAQRHVKVVLTGEGSDELLGGYYKYRSTIVNLKFAQAYSRFTTPGMRRIIRSMAGAAARGKWRRRLPRTFLWREPDITDLYFDNFAVFPAALQVQLLTDGARERMGPADPFRGMRARFDQLEDETLLARLLFTDVKTYLHELLMKQDQMSMAASLESRVPFLDHKLVEFSASLPDSLKVRGIATKRVLREAMKGVLPESILTRPKMGFPVPLERWLRTDFRPMLEEHLLGDRARSRGLFRPECVSRLIQEHVAGANHTERLWALLNLEIWQRIFMDGELPTGALPQLPESPQDGR